MPDFSMASVEIAADIEARLFAVACTGREFKKNRVSRKCGLPLSAAKFAWAAE
jgi:hypothetical protein